MQFQYSPYILPLIAAAAISSWVAVYAWSRRATASAVALALMAVAITEWSLGYSLEIAGSDLATKLFWGKIEYFGIALAPLMWLIFAVTHSNRGTNPSRRTTILLSIIPVITVLLALTTETHHLIWTDYRIAETGGFSALEVSHGPWFWVHSAYSYILLVYGTLIIILRSIWRKQGLYRRQAAALLVAVIAPWAGNILYLSGFSPIPQLDLTPFAFTITIVALAWGVLGFRLIDLVPIARSMVVEEMNEGVIVIDAQGRVADVNPAAQKLLSLSTPQAVGKPATEIFAPWAHLAQKYRDVMDALDEIAVGQGESQRWFELHLSALYDRNRRFAGRVVTVRDITRRKQAQEQLRQLSRAVEASPSSILITDADGLIQYVNPKFTQITGYALEEVQGRNPRILKTDRTPADVHRQLWETIKAGREWHGEFCNRKKNGEVYWELASVSPITDADGKITHFVAVKEDITEQRQLRERALEASQLKSKLLANVSHELRTPLSGILGYAELLQDESFGPLSQEQKQAAAQIVEGADYLTTMINELLDEAQIEARTLILRLQPCSPRATLEKAEASMSVLARNKGLALITNVEPGFPGTLTADEGRLQQILTNLIGNAIKFTKVGEVRVNLYQPDPAHWCVRVSDTGVGIEARDFARIFEPFQKLSNTLTRENRGTGLGLSITKQLVDLMGGQIGVESKLGSGSTFTVSLPVEISLGQTAPPKPLALIIEDDLALGHVFESALRDTGFETDLDTHGGQVMQRLSARPPALILLDSNMPRGGGPDLLQQIRSEKRWDETPIIVATGDLLLAKTLEGKGERVLVKPVSIAKLRELAGPVLNHRKAGVRSA